jgi:hypothetical protein
MSLPGVMYVHSALLALVCFLGSKYGRLVQCYSDYHMEKKERKKGIEKKKKTSNVDV